MHFHTLVPDGVFVRLGGGELAFRGLCAPTKEAILSIAWQACRQVVSRMQKRGEWETEISDEHLEREPTLSECLSSSVLGTLSMGKRRGKRLLRFLGAAAREGGRGESRTHASGYGFNLHAGVSVSAKNRTKLERLIRYMARPALSNERLEKLHDLRISLRLKRPWHDGTSHLIVTHPSLWSAWFLLSRRLDFI